jgi:outer membrane lipoprotein-sorting protein
VLALVAVLVLGGCAAPFGGGGDADPDGITDRVGERLNDTETLEATMSWEISVGNSSDSFTARVAYADPGRINLTYREPDPLAGAYIVNNGSAVLAVNPNADTYATSDVIGPGASLSTLFLNVASVRNATFEGNETLAGEDATKLSYAVDGSEVSVFLQGGQATSQLSDAADDDANVTVWVDRERWVPLKATVEYTDFDPPVTITLRYDDVSIDEGLSDGRFEATAPEDLVRVRSMFEVLSPQNVTGYTDYDQLVAASEGAPPTELPGGFTFQQGFSVASGEEARYRLFYTNGTANREIHFTTSPVALLEDAETTTVAGRTVNVSETGRATIMEYDCADRTYVVIGTGGREPLAETVEAIGC